MQIGYARASTQDRVFGITPQKGIFQAMYS
jgi:hypothetical protein